MLSVAERYIRDLNAEANGLVAGDVGTVVHVYPDATAFEVEFLSLDGRTAAVATVGTAGLRRSRPDEITHARDFLRPV